MWVWLSGSPNTSAVGVYGTKGVPDAANDPGARLLHGVTYDHVNDNLYIYGGCLITMNRLSDFWTYSLTLNMWTWLSGSSTINEPMVLSNPPSINDHPVSVH